MYFAIEGMPIDANCASFRTKYETSVCRSSSPLLTGVAVRRTSFFAVLAAEQLLDRLRPLRRRVPQVVRLVDDDERVLVEVLELGAIAEPHVVVAHDLNAVRVQVEAPKEWHPESSP